MKKIWMMSAVASTLLFAQELTQESLAQQLENKKIKSTQNKGYMPDISLIVDVSYTRQSFDEEGHTEHLEIPGLVHGGGHAHDDHGHTPLAGEDGFNFNYAELVIGASVDRYFDLKGVFHLSEDDFEVEEAFATTRSLPYHLQAKIGKFKSDFGYLNNKHRHNYNFYESPLVYQALFGDHGINEIGAQLQYVVPLPIYVMAGIELLNGENEQSFGTDAFSPHDASEDFVGVDEASKPALWIGYIKSSFDMAGGTLLAGVTIAQGESRIDHLEDEEGAHAFEGDTTLYGVDLTFKKYFTADHAISWQSEYIYREMDGTQYLPNEAEDDWVKKVGLNKEQAGFYSELVYQYDKNWRTGLRYSAIMQNDITVNSISQDKTDDIYVTSAMLEYNPTEFSRLRLQYNHNSSLYNEEGEKNNKNEIIVQFNYAIGAHGAHAF
jgi:outer membrane receptor protein involved in Fe transport